MIEQVKLMAKFLIVFFVSNLPSRIQNKLKKKYPYLEHLKNIKLWDRDKGDSFLRLDYKLNEKSIVFDLGGYKGKWTEMVYNKFGCKVFVFEPCQVFAEEIRRKFNDNKKVEVYDIGLGAKDEKINLFISAAGSSTFKNKGEYTEISIIKAIDFFKEKGINKIDLMKINIEGGEFELLEHLIESGYISNIKNLQVQFHYFIPDAWNKMELIQNKLKASHFITYQYPFVWENWEFKEN